ncbi:MAG: Carboxypeptidase regulatory-like domain [Flavipsychrobacter sp.]|jgi:hypothetical protein|nr:Carboxypeptidase regulatory-like domain [Flavipsychrobacter sp.]
MKQLLVLFISIFMFGSLSAQQASTQKELTPEQKRLADLRKNAVSGFVKDMRNRPVEGVQAFIYAKDSAQTILASGYTDATGYYETNSVAPGKYNIKIVYPSTNKAVMVPDVVMKRGLVDISLKTDIPTADTSINYLIFQPKPAGKSKTN